jgi:hypothetical protein
MMEQEVKINGRTFKVIPLNEVLAVNWNNVITAMRKEDYGNMIKWQVISHTGITEEEYKTLKFSEQEAILKVVNELNKQEAENFTQTKSSS